MELVRGSGVHVWYAIESKEAEPEATDTSLSRDLVSSISSAGIQHDSTVQDGFAAAPKTGFRVHISGYRRYSSVFVAAEDRENCEARCGNVRCML